MPVVTCAVTHSAPKKVLSLGHKSKGVDELNMRGRVFEISPNARDINDLNSEKHYA